MSSKTYSALIKLNSYRYSPSHVITIDRHRWVLCYSCILQTFCASLQVLVVTVGFKTWCKNLLNRIDINADLFHTLFAALLELWNLWALITDVGHPSPPFLWIFFQHDHFSDLLIQNILPSRSFFFSVLKATILLSKVAVCFETKWAKLDVINEFQVNKRVDFFIKLLKFAYEFVRTTIVYIIRKLLDSR